MTPPTRVRVGIVGLLVATTIALGQYSSPPNLLAHASNPHRLLIPTINIDTAIQQVGLTDSGAMATPTNTTDVGWYALGVAPGDFGSAVIAGHRDGAATPRAIFYNLQTLHRGDMVYVVDEHHTILNFRVTATALYDYNDSTEDVFLGDPSVARLNLISCAGQWLSDDNSYSQRVVVFTELVSADDPSITNTPR